MRGAARLMEGGGWFWGISRCAGLLDRGTEEADLGDLPLRGAARLMEGGGSFGWISRCAGLIDIRTEEDVSEGAPTARGCSLEGRRRLLLGDLPLRGADRRKDGGGCFWEISGCAGLLG